MASAKKTGKVASPKATPSKPYIRGVMQFEDDQGYTYSTPFFFNMDEIPERFERLGKLLQKKVESRE